ncbi:MAG: hypothetical protein EA363_13060 [Balneolaceae bacterium]|nr:MAG: hypothetical protein EA363_13060 [Balneolaceae bacterium]
MKVLYATIDRQVKKESHTAPAIIILAAAGKAVIRIPEPDAIQLVEMQIIFQILRLFLAIKILVHKRVLTDFEENDHPHKSVEGSSLSITMISTTGKQKDMVW